MRPDALGLPRFGASVSRKNETRSPSFAPSTSLARRIRKWFAVSSPSAVVSDSNWGWTSTPKVSDEVPSAELMRQGGSAATAGEETARRKRKTRTGRVNLMRDDRVAENGRGETAAPPVAPGYSLSRFPVPNASARSVFCSTWCALPEPVAGLAEACRFTARTPPCGNAALSRGTT